MFVHHMAERYKQGGVSEGLDMKFTLRIALMVRFLPTFRADYWNTDR